MLSGLNRHWTSCAIGLAAALGFLAPACAQNTAGIANPDVKAGARSFEYRAAYETRDDGRPGAFAHRLHYQQSFDESWQGRVVLLQSERGGEALEFRSISLEVMRQFVESETSGGWESAFRVDGLIPLADSQPGRIRAAWLNSYEFDDDWKLRAALYFGREIGDLARSGVSIETREEISRRVAGDFRIGVQAFNNFNTTAQFGVFNEQRHQLGPMLKGAITNRLSYTASALFGVSRDAADADFRLFITYSP
ncbi:MAG TPA: hypothetical protein PLV61_00415 [Parvularculaceae bacterium]|nr:hypothetical protein [Parvularculaceae bacterium]